MTVSDPALREEAWKLIYPLLKSQLSEKWLEIVENAVSGKSELALKLLDAAEEKIKQVCQGNREFMKKIRALGDEYHPGIFGALTAGALSGAAMGGGGGALVGGPIGASVGAVAGVAVGAVTGFFIGAKRAVYADQHKKK